MCFKMCFIGDLYEPRNIEGFITTMSLDSKALVICNHYILFWFDELNELGYMGFAIAFNREKV